jgi:DNA-binding transcriptional ArsR family regulator
MTRADPYFAEVAALLGDPARANMLAALMDGRPRTAKELSFIAGVSPQTTSGHLAKLAGGNLVEARADGRHRLYSLANPLVACAIEALMALSVGCMPLRAGQRRADAGHLRAARTCYDHLAGRLGVAITDALVDNCDLERGAADYHVTDCGRTRFSAFGIDVDKVARQRRGFAKPCLDWSERRPHLAGALGAAIAQRCFDLNWLERRPGTRAIRVTEPGRAGLRRAFAVEFAAEKLPAGL